MATTTNYGWTTPDDTALVKDGASAIRTLGSSVDTTTKNLNPETTLGDLSFRSSTSNVNTRIGIGSSGQFLSVVGGVPAWATATDQTPLTTKGDIFTFSTVDARLAVGTNGQVLTCDSSETTGLKFATPAGGGKVLQVVEGVLTAGISTTSNAFGDTGLTVNITPSSATSKVLVIATMTSVAKWDNDANNAVVFKLLRGATDIFLGGGYNGFTATALKHNFGSVVLQKLDSPATTSATTYKVQWKSATSGGESYANMQGGESNTQVSTIIAMEIGA